MDKGIRPACNAKFLELLPARTKDRAGNVLFRKNVMCSIMEDFGITLASAATHYNHAFLEAKKASLANPTLAEQLEGLGRPEDKKGGRKKKEVPATPAADAAPAAEPAATVVDDSNDAGETGEAQTVFGVYKVKDGSLVAGDLTHEAALAMVAANEGKKFVPKLYWK